MHLLPHWMLQTFCLGVFLCFCAGIQMQVSSQKFNSTIILLMTKWTYLRHDLIMSVFPLSERRLRTTRRRRRQHLLVGCGLIATAGLLPFRLTLNQSDRLLLIGRRLMDTGPRLKARLLPLLWQSPVTKSPCPLHPFLLS